MNTSTQPHHGVAEFLKDVIPSFNKMGLAGFVWLAILLVPAVYAVFKAGRESAPQPTQPAPVVLPEQKEAIQSLNKVIADQNATIAELRRESASLRAEIGKLADENAKARASVDAAKRSLEATKVDQAGQRSAGSLENRPKAEVAPRAETPAVAAPTQSRSTRKEVTLTTGDAMRVRDDVTVTLNDVNQNGAFLMINGGIYNYQRVGNRIDLSVKSRERCFLEILSLASKDLAPGRVRADLVCEPRAE